MLILYIRMPGGRTSKLKPGVLQMNSFTKADTLKATEANRRMGPGTREKVRLKRINLEGNTHAQEINVSQCPV
jgi:hypothetical protein